MTVSRTVDERRARMVERQLRRRGIADERVLAAMGRVPREAFVPGPIADHAYDDAALPIGEDQTISQPYIVATMCELLMLDEDRARPRCRHRLGVRGGRARPARRERRVGRAHCTAVLASALRASPWRRGTAMSRYASRTAYWSARPRAFRRRCARGRRGDAHRAAGALRQLAPAGAAYRSGAPGQQLTRIVSTPTGPSRPHARVPLRPARLARPAARPLPSPADGRAKLQHRHRARRGSTQRSDGARLRSSFGRFCRRRDRIRRRLSRYTLLLEARRLHYLSAAIGFLVVAVTNNYPSGTAPGRSGPARPRRTAGGSLPDRLDACARREPCRPAPARAAGLARWSSRATHRRAMTPVNFVGNKLWSFRLGADACGGASSARRRPPGHRRHAASGHRSCAVRRDRPGGAPAATGAGQPRLFDDAGSRRSSSTRRWHDGSSAIRPSARRMRPSTRTIAAWTVTSRRERRARSRDVFRRRYRRARDRGTRPARRSRGSRPGGRPGRGRWEDPHVVAREHPQPQPIRVQYAARSRYCPSRAGSDAVPARHPGHRHRSRSGPAPETPNAGCPY